MPDPNTNSTQIQKIARQASDVYQRLSTQLKHGPHQGAVDAFGVIVTRFVKTAGSLDNETIALAEPLPKTIQLFGDLIDPSSGIEAPKLTRILSSTDNNGKTLSDALRDLASSPHKSALPILNASLERILGRERPHRAPVGSDMAEVYSKLIFQASPAEWIRVMACLSKDSSVTLKGGPVLTLPNSVDQSPLTSRLPGFARNFECAVKSTFPPAVLNSSPPATFTYNVEENQFDPPAGAPNAKEDPELSTLSALIAFTGGNLAPVQATGDMGRLSVAIRDASPGSPIAAMIDLNGTLTPVLVTGAADGRVTFFNPASPNSAVKGREIPKSDPPRKLSPQGLRIESMNESDFLSVFKTVFAPVEVAKSHSTAQLVNAIKQSLDSQPTKVLLDNLKARGVLDKVDANGFSVAYNLVRVASGLQHDRDTQQHYLEAFVERLHHPGSSTQQNHGTCGAESILRLMNITNVGEWSRVASDLILRNKSTLLRGLQISPPNDWVKPDRSPDRHPLDALLQSSLMKVAAPTGWTYSNRSDRFIKLDGSEAPKEAGFSTDAIEQVVTQFSGRDMEWVNNSELKDPALFKHLMPGSGRGTPVLAALDWLSKAGASGSHAVLVTDCNTRSVCFSNPHGEIKDPTTGQPLANGTKLTAANGGPDRQIIDNAVGLQSVDRKTFEKYTSKILVDRDDRSAYKVKTSSWRPIKLLNVGNPFSPYSWLTLGAITAGLFGSRELEAGGVAPWQKDVDSKPVSALVDRGIDWAKSLVPPRVDASDKSAPAAASQAPGQPVPASRATPSGPSNEPSRRLNREATDDAFNSLFVPPVRGAQAPAAKVEPKTPGAVYQSLQTKAAPLIRKDFTVAAQFITDHGGKVPATNLATLKLVMGTFSDYRFTISNLKLDSADGTRNEAKEMRRMYLLKTLSGKEAGWSSYPAKELETTNLKNANYVGLLPTLEPLLNKLLNQIGGGLQALGEPVPGRNLTSLPSAVETLLKFQGSVSRVAPSSSDNRLLLDVAWGLQTDPQSQIDGLKAYLGIKDASSK